MLTSKFKFTVKHGERTLQQKVVSLRGEGVHYLLSYIFFYLFLSYFGRLICLGILGLFFKILKPKPVETSSLPGYCGMWAIPRYECDINKIQVLQPNFMLIYVIRIP